MFAFQSNQSCKINCVTWGKDAHALFDYESEEITKDIYTLGKGGKIFLDQEKGTTKYEPDNHEEGFFLTGGHSSSSEGCLINFFNEYGSHTRVTKKIKDEYEYKPQINDIIRFGRVQFVVRSMKDKSVGNNNNEDNNNKPVFLPNDNSNLKTSGNNKALICELCEKKETDSINNPIIKICPCKKCPLLHIKCFKNEYIKKDKMFCYSNKDYMDHSLKIVSFINFLCPLCNEPYNPIIKINSRFYNIIPYTFDKDVFHLVLESINFVKDGIYCMMVIIFLFPNKKEVFYLGRGHEASFKISDISISRIHAKIYLKDENIYIDDLGSKFGTLLLARNSIDVGEMLDKKMKIQIGRNVIWLDKDNSEDDNADNNNKENENNV